MNVPHLRLVPSVDAVHDRPRRRFGDLAPFPIAALGAGTAVSGMLWIDLAVAAGLCAAGAVSLRGSRRARIVVAGLLLYLGYASAVRAVAMPFDALFLAQCATLGASAFALVDLGHALYEDRAWAWFDDRSPHRIGGAMLIASAAVLGTLWVARVVPVTALDLALVLPALAVVAVDVLRRRSPATCLHAATLLGFVGMLSLSLVGGDLATMIALGAVAVASLSTFGALVACVTGATRWSAR